MRPPPLVRNREVRVAQLIGRHRCRRALEQRARRSGLRERDHVAQRRRAGQHHRDAVHAERDAAVRRRAGAQPFEQEPEPRLRRGLVDAEQREHAALERRIGDSDASAAQFRAVEHHVVRLSAHASRGPLSSVAHVVGSRRGERVVHRRQRSGGGIAVEHREVGHPAEMRARRRAPAPGGGRRPAARDPAPGWPSRSWRCDVADPAPLQPAAAGLLRRSARNLAAGPSQLAVDALEPQAAPWRRRPSPSASTSSSCLRDSAALRQARRCRARAHPAASAERVMPNSVSRNTSLDVGDLESVPQVGPVAAVPLHRRRVGHARERRRYRVAGLGPQRGDQPLGDRDDVLDADERRLDVDLRELRLAVGPQVLVAEAARHLEVAVVARDHQ